MHCPRCQTERETSQDDHGVGHVLRCATCKGVIDAKIHDPDGTTYTGLTPRQRQILPLLIYSNAEIAARLGIAEKTVKNHVSAIYRCLLDDGALAGCCNPRALTVVMAIGAGLIDLEEIYGSS